MMKCQYSYQDTETEIDLEENPDIETLKYQIISLADIDFDELILVDYCGRVVGADEDIRILCKEAENSNISVLNLWCITKNIPMYTSCTKRLFPTLQIVQPGKNFIDTDFTFCHNCVQYFDESLISNNQSNILQSFICRHDDAIEIGLSSIQSKDLNTSNDRYTKIPSPVLLYYRRQIYTQALQQISPYTSVTQEMIHFEKRIQMGMETILEYENPIYQQKARQTINYFKLLEYQQNELQEHPNMSKDLLFIRSLLRWFKQDFFQWCNAPTCDNITCPSKLTTITANIPVVNVTSSMQGKGAVRSSYDENNYGKASITELYECSVCHQITRFPRYNNACHLLTTKRGRCGEWANTFCLIARSVGLDVKYIMDWTDHVWVEIWIPSLNRYIHTDACEQACDTPLTYESGWNKSLKHILSFSKYSIHDVTSRYTRHLDEVLIRRSQDIPEAWTKSCVNKYHTQMLQRYTHENNTKPYTTPVNQTSIVNHIMNNNSTDTTMEVPIELRIINSTSIHYDTVSVGEKGFADIANTRIPLDVAHSRIYLEQRELDGMMFLDVQDVKLEERRGRISGDLQWRLQRGEIDIKEVNI